MTNPDELLDALDQISNTLFALGEHLGTTAADTLTEAIDDWVGEHAAEHHHSKPFTAVEADQEPFAGALRQLLAAVSILDHPAHRPGLTVAAALTEAIADWNAEHAAEFNRSRPFQPQLPQQGQRPAQH